VRNQKQLEFEIASQPSGVAELDLVVPFTTPHLTRVALEAAGRMGVGLDAAVRLIKVQVVPIQLNPEQSPVYLDFLKTQLEQFQSTLPMTGEIRLARDFEPGLSGALRQGSVVILATKKRPWRTRTERLARSLRRSGHKVIVVSEEVKNA
jgi:hypothetical protein